MKLLLQITLLIFEGLFAGSICSQRDGPVAVGILPEPSSQGIKLYRAASFSATKYLGFICGQSVDRILSTQPITNGKE